MSKPTHRAQLLSALLILASTRAFATCAPTANTIYVGSGAQCDTGSIQAAIDAVACVGTTVVVSTHNGETYTGQHLSIANKSLAITGTTSGCDAPPVICDPVLGCGGGAPPRIMLRGNDGIDQAVVTITGSSRVILNNFKISGARDTAFTSNDGGAIAFLNDGSLTLNNVDITQNYASHGGGIAMLASGGHADLVIGAHTIIHDNTAQFDGGGIYARGDVHVTMTQDQSAIYANHALGEDGNGQPVRGDGNGGGIDLEGGRVDIGSPGLSGCTAPVCPPQNAAIALNTAVFGGGVYVRNNGTEDGVAALFTTDRTRPTTLLGNSASQSAGALDASIGLNGSGAALCLFGVHATGNQAPDAAIARTYQAGLFINTDPHGTCDEAAMAALGAVDCGNTPGCNEFNGNTTTDADGALFLTQFGDTNLDRLAVRNNHASNGFVVTATGASDPHLTNCLIADNQFDSSAVYLAYRDFYIDGCTFANNTIADNNIFVVYSDSRPTTLHLTRSIVIGDADDVTAYFYRPDTASLTANYNVLGELGTVGNGSGNFSADPDFVDAAHGNYHLSYSSQALAVVKSPAVDHAPATGSSVHDLDGEQRVFDAAGGTNVFGPRDLGAYEWQFPCAAADNLFCDGFDPLISLGF